MSPDKLLPDEALNCAMHNRENQNIFLDKPKADGSRKKAKTKPYVWSKEHKATLDELFRKHDGNISQSLREATALALGVSEEKVCSFGYLNYLHYTFITLSPSNCRFSK